MNNIDLAIRNWMLQRNANQELYLPEVGFLSVVRARETELVRQSQAGVHERLLPPFYAVQVGLSRTQSGAVHVADLLSIALGVPQDLAQMRYDNWLSGQLLSNPLAVVIEGALSIEFLDDASVVIGEIDPLFEQILSPSITPLAIDPIRGEHRANGPQGGIKKRGITQTNPSGAFIVISIIVGVVALLFLGYMMLPEWSPVKVFLDQILGTVI